MAEEEPEVIREQIRETQDALASKLSTLEDKVVNTVTNTTESVSETVEAVRESVAGTIESMKESMDSTVQAVKRTFDLNHQVREHPWLMMGGAAAAGFVAGRLLRGVAHSPANGAWRVASESAQYARPQPPAAPAASPQPNGCPRAEEPSLLDRLTHQFHDELEQVKGLAIGAIFGLVRDWASQQLPDNLAPQVQEMLDNVTTKLGGTRIEGSVVENLSAKWGERGSRREPAHT
jgi:ElaB/YqjD/DUF883 family membrane-anchored ribosome-binding protein